MATKKTQSQISQFDRTTCKLLSAEFLKAMQEVATKYGVSIRAAGGKFEETNFQMKFEAAVTNTETGVVASKEAQDFKKFSHMFDVPASKLGKKLTINDRVFTLVGLVPSRPKFPFIATAADGKRFKFTVATIQNAL